MNYYSSSCGRIELQIELSDAEIGSHSGSCDNDIAYLLTVPYIAKQLTAIEPELLANELKGYGAWDSHELADNEENKARLLWLACGEIVDRQFEENNQ
jgi:hypothetical protein